MVADPRQLQSCAWLFGQRWLLAIYPRRNVNGDSPLLRCRSIQHQRSALVDRPRRPGSHRVTDGMERWRAGQQPRLLTSLPSDSSPRCRWRDGASGTGHDDTFLNGLLDAVSARLTEDKLGANSRERVDGERAVDGRSDTTRHWEFQFHPHILFLSGSFKAQDADSTFTQETPRYLPE